MREAVGGSMLFYIILIFIFIYIVFIGLIMNYAATYRASNYVITELEQSEGNIVSDMTSNSSFCTSLRNRNYHNKLYVSCHNDRNQDAIYKVTTFVSFELPLMGVDLDLKINNETKALYGAQCLIDENDVIEACMR